MHLCLGEPLRWEGFTTIRCANEMRGKGVRNSFPYLLLLLSGGETLKNFQARFPGTMRAEKQLLYWSKGQRDTSTEANQTTR